MSEAEQQQNQRTNVDVVFDYLYEEIASLRLLPDDKISEADIAAQFNVSRQPVRDAFSRLANMDLLMIRPKRATKVMRFSRKEIAKSRFVRAAVEGKVLQLAASRFDAHCLARLNENLDAQGVVVDQQDYAAFTKLDYDFHKIICEIAGADFAFDVISVEKAKVDRLCTLSLSKRDRMPQLLRDHQMIVERLRQGDADGAVEVGMRHLSRLDDTIEAISASNANYFDP